MVDCEEGVKMILNKWEIEILNIVKKDGKINDLKLRLIYRDPIKRKDALTRLSQLGYLKILMPGIFGWTGKEFDVKVKSKKIIFTKEQQEQIKKCLENCEGSELERTLREITKIK